MSVGALSSLSSHIMSVHIPSCWLATTSVFWCSFRSRSTSAHYQYLQMSIKILLGILSGNSVYLFIYFKLHIAPLSFTYGVVWVRTVGNTALKCYLHRQPTSFRNRSTVWASWFVIRRQKALFHYRI